MADGDAPAHAGRATGPPARLTGAAPGATRRRWRAWRRSRPFWGGLLVALGGAEILVTLRAPLPVILHIGPQGLAGYLGPVILLLCGVLLVAHPPQRVFYALVSLVLALVSWLTSNLGGFFVGMLLALVGGCLAFAWTPVRKPRPGTTPATHPATTLPIPVADGRHRREVDQT
ncbi:DUF6114 domain-containing protein [Micromonospora sp. NBC_01655]|uniref:DUF6114 domain-containing protein n=1 Tax=Micromonospora sp. NBC_01655 TaxID=2975983 RepID=UPI002256B2DF|nr:DUF6114 domain-containing protein [Micromonospora sp. NBC_01655]MCX4471246.1 DUF6114 domain-containing protein [Micromonospora sp. NBC_01655]